MEHSENPSTIDATVDRWTVSTPTAIAVRDGADSLSYGTLGARADALADRLRAAGVGSESTVAVAIPRSIDYVVAILGVLKTGAGYVPLDVGYPAARIRFMLADSGARIVLAAADTAARLDVPDGVPVIDISSTSEPGPTTGPAPQDRLADGLAYLIYTSGSTGTPKGVAVTHANVLSLLAGDERLAVAPDDRVAQLAPVSFDASTFEIWGALCAGGQVLIMPGPPLSVARIATALREGRPHWLFLTTGLFHVIADHDIEALASVGTLITGGDVLSPGSIRKSAAVTRTVAAYGPTETTVFASLHEVSPDADDGPVPIGTPVGGTTMRVLDADLRPAPAGTTGEIAIGGAGVARGYHGQPALTAARFRPDPLSPTRGARMYLTGDLGCQRPAGGFDFHGRRDRQVKVRGYRIELGEIESALTAHPGCGSAAATTIAVDGGEKRLVAYVTWAKDAQVTMQELRTWLADRLPPYAIPTRIVALAEMPLDDNGKNDRRRLPNPWTSRTTLVGSAPLVAPSDELEAAIAEVWADVLDLDHVGVTDDFFELGGDSLRSVSLLAQLSGRGIRLSAGDLFGRANVRACADLNRQRHARLGAPTPRSVRRPASRPGEG